MYKLNYNNIDKITEIFEGWNETLIWSCLEGYMGEAWVADIENPKSALIIVGDFGFVGGFPDIDLMKKFPSKYQGKRLLLLPENEAWEKIIENEFKGNCERIFRYSIKKEDDIFDKTKLVNNVEQLPEDYQIEKIDKVLYDTILLEEWSESLCSNYPTYEHFKNDGIGYVILHNEEIVCGASSYSVYSKGIEIEIDTRKDYRRKGLAYICASKLILKCLEKGLYPSWDAANIASVRLAEKLGYHLEGEYVTYIIEYNGNI